MKKTLIWLGLLGVVVAGVFIWLLSEASDANAPGDVRVIELPDTYEK